MFLFNFNELGVIFFMCIFSNFHKNLVRYGAWFATMLFFFKVDIWLNFLKTISKRDVSLTTLLLVSWKLQVKVFLLKYLNFHYKISLDFYFHHLILNKKRNCLQKRGKPIKILILLEKLLVLLVEMWSLQLGLSGSSLYTRSFIVQLSLSRCKR